MHKFEENVKESVGIIQGAVSSTAGEVDGASVDMAKYNNYVAVIQMMAQTQYGGAITCVIAESTDDSTWSDTYLATVTIASSTNTNKVDTVELRAEEMTEGYRYLRCEITPTTPGTSLVFGAVNLQFNPRFAAVS